MPTASRMYTVVLDYREIRAREEFAEAMRRDVIQPRTSHPFAQTNTAPGIVDNPLRAPSAGTSSPSSDETKTQTAEKKG